MSLLTRAEQALSTHFEQAAGVGAPPRLVAAMRHAVFSGGARIRPQLCMAVATACGDDTPELTNAAAVALELMHCASLVHDDMPAFDNADTRRGRPTVHKAFSEPLALLAGDGLIVMAYRVLLQAGVQRPERLIALMDNLTSGVLVLNADGTITVSGNLAEWANTGSTYIGNNGTGTVNVLTQGEFLGGVVYLAVSVAGGLFFLALAVRLWRSRAGDQPDKAEAVGREAALYDVRAQAKPARNLFAFSILYLMALFAALLVESLTPGL